MSQSTLTCMSQLKVSVNSCKNIYNKIKQTAKENKTKNKQNFRNYKYFLWVKISNICNGTKKELYKWDCVSHLKHATNEK